MTDHPSAHALILAEDQAAGVDVFAVEYAPSPPAPPEQPQPSWQPPPPPWSPLYTGDD